MNMQTITTEGLNAYRQEELYKASEAVRADRLHVGASAVHGFTRVLNAVTTLRGRLNALTSEPAASASR